MSHRPLQLASEIRRVVSEVFNEHIEFPPGLLVTVVGTDISSDLKKATIRLSILPEHKQGTGLEAAKKRSGFIQRNVARNLPMKSIPRIELALADQTWLDAQNLPNP